MLFRSAADTPAVAGHKALAHHQEAEAVVHTELDHREQLEEHHMVVDLGMAVVLVVEEHRQGDIADSDTVLAEEDLGRDIGQAVVLVLNIALEVVADRSCSSLVADMVAVQVEELPGIRNTGRPALAEVVESS